ncbi:MAG: DNA-directed RNA polymerase subunit omega [Candidatus Omnitrophota bacterium]|nr:DNA-directed RNA polymerase subunit omega [Candidatus Omnitrophota bacterium]
MPYIPLEKLVTDKQDSIYKLCLTAAARANELAQGAQPLVKSESKKAAVIALEEIAAGKISYQLPKTKTKKL